jgi:pimeloyl-ACP methyl ester carboxylesterase
MATSIRRPTSRFSTTVRFICFAAIRIGFAVGSRLAPRRTIERAAKLFSTPSIRQRPSPDALVGAATTAVEIGGRSVATYAWGDPATQPYVLFAHGWSSHGSRVASWVPALRAAGFAVVAFDQAGHGRSAGHRTTLPEFTNLLLEIARRHGPAEAVIGHSLGGTAAALALARGLPAARAILVAPAADPVDAAHRFARVVGMAEHLCQRMFALFESRLGIGFQAQQAHNNVPSIGRPALVVHDLEDAEVPWAEGERYARYWPHSRLLTTRGLGHRRILDDARVIAAGLAFLRGESVGERVVSSPNLPFGVA